MMSLIVVILFLVALAPAALVGFVMTIVYPDLAFPAVIFTFGYTFTSILDYLGTPER